MMGGRGSSEVCPVLVAGHKMWSLSDLNGARLLPWLSEKHSYCQSCRWLCHFSCEPCRGKKNKKLL